MRDLRSLDRVRSWIAGVASAALLCLGLAACKTEGLFCDDDNPCLPRFPDKPFCDKEGVTAESEGIRNTCVSEAPTADAGMFDAMTADASLPDGPAVQCNGPSDCDDGKYCNGVEQCQGMECAAGTPVSCPGSTTCTSQTCSDDLSGCVGAPAEVGISYTWPSGSGADTIQCGARKDVYTYVAGDCSWTGYCGLDDAGLLIAQFDGVYIGSGLMICKAAARPGVATGCDVNGAFRCCFE